jgi:hypothetical protein
MEFAKALGRTGAGTGKHVVGLVRVRCSPMRFDVMVDPDFPFLRKDVRMRIAASTIALLVAVLILPTVTQGSTREEFKEYCRALQGRWIGDVTWVADWPSFGKRGDKVTCYFEGGVAEDGNVMKARFIGGIGAGTAIYYFDPGTKEIRSLWVNTGGGVERGTIRKSGDKWLLETSGCLKDGTKVKYTTMVTFADNGNTSTRTGSGTVGGKKVDDQHDVWRRLSK